MIISDYEHKSNESKDKKMAGWGGGVVWMD